MDDKQLDEMHEANTLQEAEQRYWELPVCDFCNKPHYGVKEKSRRCQCDMSGHYHMETVDVLKII